MRSTRTCSIGRPSRESAITTGKEKCSLTFSPSILYQLILCVRHSNKNPDSYVLLALIHTMKLKQILILNVNCMTSSPTQVRIQVSNALCFFLHFAKYPKGEGEKTARHQRPPSIPPSLDHRSRVVRAKA